VEDSLEVARSLHSRFKTWVEFDGTSVTPLVWDGRANLQEFEPDSPAGGHTKV
jgi:hypothetical protein